MTHTSTPMAALASSAPAALTFLVVQELGPVAGQLFLILLGACAGAFWALGKRDKGATPGAMLFMARLMAASAVMASAASWALERYFGLPYPDCLLVTSFLLAAFSELWSMVVTSLVSFMSKSRTS